MIKSQPLKTRGLLLDCQPFHGARVSFRTVCNRALTWQSAWASCAHCRHALGVQGHVSELRNNALMTSTTVC
jgi:hypothetical protein